MRALALLVVALAAFGCAKEDTAPDDGSGSSGEPTGVKDASTGSGKKDDAGRRDASTTPSATKRDSSVSNNGMQAPECGNNIIQAKPISADFLIVQDRSSSMSGLSLSADIGSDRWTPSVAALKEVVNDYDDSIRFGLLLFPSSGQACDSGSVSVEISEQAGEMISSALDMNAPSLLFNGIGQTPTDLALQQALEVIKARPQGNPDEPPINNAYVLLVTDGAPGCNLGATEQPRVDAANAAIDELLKMDVKTYVVGYDIDEAGAAIMNEFAKRGGTEQYIAVNTDDADALEKALRDVTAGNVPCKYELPGTPSSTDDITVKIDNTELVISEAEGWTIDGKVVQFNGGSCAGLRDGAKHNVIVNVPCTVVLL